MRQATIGPDSKVEFAVIRDGHRKFEVCNCGSEDGRGAALSLRRKGHSDRLKLRAGEGAVIWIGPGKWNFVNTSSKDDPQHTTLIWRALKNAHLS
jgi:sarcosine oxidase gamma subunit